MTPPAASLLALLPLLSGDEVWERFPAFVWRPPFPEAALDESLADAFRAANVERHDEAREVRAAGLDFYVGHAPGRNVLHLERDSGDYLQRWEAWLASRDTGELVRDPCLSDPATAARLAEHLERSLAARGGDHGLAISLGDEVSFTPWGDPVDLCRSEFCERAWVEHAEARGLPTEFPDTDRARRRLAEEDERELGAWLERRRFNHDLVLAHVRRLAERSRELSPATPVAALGLTGRTAFGGLSVPGALATLDVLEPYQVSLAREMAFTLRRSDQALWWTVLVDRTSPADARRQVWDHALRGGDGLVLYRERFLLEQAETTTALSEAVGDVRELRARDWPRPARRPSPRGVALVQNDDSIALGFLRDAALEGESWPHRLAGYQERRGTFESAARTWREATTAVGLLPAALPADRVDERSLETYPVLILLHLAVLSRDELQGLERYLRAGGRVVVEGDLGAFRPDGTRRTPDALAVLGERFPGRVYQRVRSAESQLAALLSRIGFEFAPRVVRAARAADTRQFAVPLPDGGWWIALLPRAGDEDVRWLVEHHAERLTWLFPADAAGSAVTTRPGEPVVFRLAP